MPLGDGTGPAGMGPMTNPIPRGGFGAWGRGFWGGGRGWRNMYYATGLTGWQRAGMGAPAFGGFAPYVAPFAPTATRQQELDMLKGQAEYFEDALEGIKKRIGELESQTEK